MFPHTVTVYRAAAAGYDRQVLVGVLWQDTSGEAVKKSGTIDTNSLELYVPVSVGFEPRKGDLVLKGSFDYEVQEKVSELYALGDVRILRSVDVFDFGGLQHYKAGGR